MKYLKLKLLDTKSRLYYKNQFDGHLVFGSKNFHKNTNRTGKGPANGKMVPELKKVVSKKDQKVRLKKYWTKINKCPVCKSKKIKLFTKRHCLEIQKCEDCTLGFLSPRLKFKTAMKLYSNEKTSFNIQVTKQNIELDRLKYRYGLSIINSLGGNQETCLDLGAGNGLFLKTANTLGWKQCIGVDVNKKWKKNFIKKEGISLINSQWEKINNISFEKKLNLITMWDSFEHTYDLDYLTKFIKKKLSKNGFFLILVPNFHSLATKTIRGLSPTFNWKHTLHFTKESLKKWEKKNKMKNIFFETVISEIENIKSYLSGKYPYDGYGDPKNIFKNITPEFIHKNHLGSRILAIYKKL